MYKKINNASGTGYELLCAFATTTEVVDTCVINGKTFGQMLDEDAIELLG